MLNFKYSSVTGLGCPHLSFWFAQGKAGDCQGSDITTHTTSLCVIGMSTRLCLLVCLALCSFDSYFLPLADPSIQRKPVCK